MNQVTLEVYADCRTVRVGQPVHLRFIASGNLTTPLIHRYLVGGTATVMEPACAVPDPDLPPRPGVGVQDHEQVYRAPGQDRVVVTASTFCSRFSGQDSAEILIDVRP